MAEKLIRVAAQREVISVEKINIPENYQEFSNRFPFELTDDQENAINEIISDLEVGKLMDRLICGDVGFSLDIAYLIDFNRAIIEGKSPTNLRQIMRF